MRNISFFLSENLQLWRWTFLYIYLNRRVFVLNSFSFFDCFVDLLAYSKFVLNVLLTIHLYNEILVEGSGGQSIACKYLLHCHYRWCCLNLCSRDCFVHGSWTFLPPLCCLLGAEVWSIYSFKFCEFLGCKWWTVITFHLYGRSVVCRTLLKALLC